VVLETQDPKGRVLKSSHLIMSGFCRDVFMAEHPGMRYDDWTWVSWEEKAAEPGMYAYVDLWGNDHAFAVSFEADLDKLHPEIDRSQRCQEICQCVVCARAERSGEVLKDTGVGGGAG
jgi:hypothetical protein